jgi:hypothetical protein
MPTFDPGPWNDPSAIDQNNCYNYALNRPDNVRRDPGALCGRPIDPRLYSIGPLVALAAYNDGLQPAASPPPVLWQNDDRWLVALVIAPPMQGAPSGDYHWLRRDNNGLWSHKSGFGANAEDVDFAGNQFTDPLLSIWIPYVFFIGYLVVEKARLKG